MVGFVKNTPTAEELAQVKIELGEQQAKKKAKEPSKKKFVALSSESEADSSALLISVFTKPRPQKKRTKKTMALADVVSLVPPVQPALSAQLVSVQPAPIQSVQPEPSVHLSVPKVQPAQPVLPRKQRSKQVKSSKAPTTQVFDPPPVHVLKGITISEPSSTLPSRPSVSYVGKRRSQWWKLPSCCLQPRHRSIWC